MHLHGQAGTLDNTFSGDGKTTFNAGGDTKASAVVVQPDGKILFAPKAAIVSVRLYIRGTYEQQPFEGHIRYTRFWMLRERHWQLVGGHSSVVV